MWLLVLGLLALPTVAAGLLAGVAPWLTAARLSGALGLMIGLLLVLNRDVYTWFARQRGWWFAAGAVLAHWAYYLYSAAVFGILLLEHFVRAPFRPRPPRNPAQAAKLNEEPQE